MYLSLPLRQAGRIITLVHACRASLFSAGFNGRVCTSLEEALDAFHQPEKLTGDNKWYCDHCKEHRDSTRNRSLGRALFT